MGFKQTHAYFSRKISKKGFTLLELMVAIAIVGILAAIATPYFFGYLNKTRYTVAIHDIQQISTEIEIFYINNNRYPNDLGEIGMASAKDPWGNPYQYLNIASVKGKGQLRKDHSLVPVNSDYDLYSMGADGKSQPPFTAQASQDDIVRAHDGAYLGYVKDF